MYMLCLSNFSYIAGFNVQTFQFGFGQDASDTIHTLGQENDWHKFGSLVRYMQTYVFLRIGVPEQVIVGLGGGGVAGNDSEYIS